MRWQRVMKREKLIRKLGKDGSGSGGSSLSAIGFFFGILVVLYVVAAIMYFSYFVYWYICLAVVGVADLLAICGMIAGINGRRSGIDRTPVSLIAILVSFGFIMASVAVPVSLVHDRNVKLRPFEDSVSAYALIKPGPPNPTATAKGKAVVVDRKTGKIDAELFLRLPEEIRAHTPDEADVIVLVKRGTNRVAGYTDGTSLYSRNCDVVLVDPTTHSIIAQEFFVGYVNPPRSKNAGIFDRYGPWPDKLVVNYLIGVLGNKLE